MSSQTFEILCPVCRSVVPLDAPSCPTCARAKLRDTAPAHAPAVVAPAPQAAAAAPPPAPLDFRAMPMRDYHRVVRATYQATEGPPTGGSRVRAYLPFMLLLVLLIVGAAMLYGHI